MVLTYLLDSAETWENDETHSCVFTFPDYADEPKGGAVQHLFAHLCVKHKTSEMTDLTLTKLGK